MLHLMLKNTYRTKRSFVGYLLASTIAIALFFCFGFISLHPELARQGMPDVLVQLILLGQIGVALFAIFFVIFFHRFLLRGRGKEFGLLLTLGIPPQQLARGIWIESLILGAIAGVGGLLVGTGGTYALIPTLSQLLGTPPLAITFAPMAVLYGCSFFAVLFVIDAWLCARFVRVQTPKQLLLAPCVPQKQPPRSLLQTLTGFACLVVAYTLALVVSAYEIVGTASMLPIVVLCSTGTYLLFSQVLALVLAVLRKRPVSGLVLLSISRLLSRVLDYARILTVVSLLSAGVLTLLAVVVGSLAYIRERATSPSDYQTMLQIVAVALFISFFLCVLCGIAAASTLYLKVFTQLEDDRRQFARLRRIGVSKRGFDRMILAEFALVFLAPLLVAVVHSAVAIGEVTLHLIPDSATGAVMGTWHAYALVVVLYVGMFALGCGATWLHYTRRVVRHSLR